MIGCATINVCLMLMLGGLTHSITLLEERVLVREGASFFQIVIDEDINISKCRASFEFNKTIVVADIDLKYRNVTFSDNYKDTTKLKSRIKGLETGRCGFKLENTNEMDPSKWTIEVTDKVSNDKSSASFLVGIYKAKNLDSKQVVTLGHREYIRCGNQQGNQLLCFMYNPRGQLVASGKTCSYSTIITEDDLGTWKCSSLIKQATLPLQYTVQLVRKEKWRTEKWINETKDFVSFGCQILNLDTYLPPEYCILTSPEGEKLLIQPGHATERYTSISTNLTIKRCGVEVKKPLLNSERGLWMCEFGDQGTLILVGNKTSTQAMNDAKLIIRTEETQNFTVRCKIPYSASYCFIISPNGTKHTHDLIDRSSLGECSLLVPNAQLSYNGTWSCYFMSDNEVEALQQKVDIIVRKNFTCDTHLSAELGDEITMACRTGKKPLDYCWFMSPNKTTYYLTNTAKTTEVSYFGRGLEYGDCGIKIHKAHNVYEGQWTCIFSTDASDINKQIKVELLPSINYRAITGGSIGICLLFISGLAAVIYKKKSCASRTIRTQSENILLNETNNTLYESTSSTSGHERPLGRRQRKQS